MSWDEDRPAGSTPVREADDLLRENNAAIEAAVDAEHFFATGGSQGGRHKFVATDDTQRAVDFSSPASGNVHINDGTDGYAKPYMQHYDGSSWVPLDCLDPDVPHIDQNKVWTAQQHAAYASATLNVADIEWDHPDGSAFKVTLTGGTTTAYTLTNPTTTVPADELGVWLFEITQGGSNDHTITFESDFVAEWGSQPDLKTGSGEKTYIWAYSTADQKLMYSVRWR